MLAGYALPVFDWNKTHKTNRHESVATWVSSGAKYLQAPQNPEFRRPLLVLLVLQQLRNTPGKCQAIHQRVFHGSRWE